MLASGPGRQYSRDEAHRILTESSQREKLVPGWELTTRMQRRGVLLAVHAWLKANRER